MATTEGESLMLLKEYLENQAIDENLMRELIIGLLDVHKTEIVNDEMICLGCGGVFVSPCPTIQYITKGLA